MDFKERQRKYELQTDQDGNRKMEKKFQADRKKTIKQKFSRNVSGNK